MKSPYEIIVKPHITEKTVSLSYGDPRIKDDELQVRTYTFVVSGTANKIEIKQAFEQLYNMGKKEKADPIEVENVRTIVVKGKTRRIGQARRRGKRPDWKKALITLKRGQYLEDYGV